MEEIRVDVMRSGFPTGPVVLDLAIDGRPSLVETGDVLAPDGPVLVDLLVEGLQGAGGGVPISLRGQQLPQVLQMLAGSGDGNRDRDGDRRWCGGGQGQSDVFARFSRTVGP